MKRVLFLTKYTSQAASTRLRMIQYFPLLESQGITCTLSPLFESDYLKRKFAGRAGNIGEALHSFPRRILAILQASRWDAVVIQYDLLPYLPEFLELSLRVRRIPYIYDYDDAIFHYYDLHRSSIVRFLLGNKIRNVIKGAHAVLAGSPYLVDYARAVNRNVEWSPTCVDIVRFRPRVWDNSSNKPFTIGWIGAPSSVHLAAEAIPAIRELARRIPVRLVYVGSGPVSYDGFHPEIRDWSEATEVEEMLQFDVGIMPMPDEPWMRGKCAFKLIQYMACGLPVVASPVGMNLNVVTAGDNGFLASSPSQWVEALETLASDVDLRRKMGAKGRLRVERDFTSAIGGAKLLNAVKMAIRRQSDTP